MRSIVLLSISIALSLSFGLTAFEQLTDSKGRILYLIQEAKTWEGADSYCESLFPRGRLVSVRDETEAHNIAELINDLHSSYHWRGQLTYYVGGRWSVMENSWINTDGTRTSHPRQLCDGAAMTLGILWKRGDIMPTCNPSYRKMFFICADSKE